MPKLSGFDPYKEDRERRAHERAVEARARQNQIKGWAINRPQFVNEHHGESIRKPAKVTLPYVSFKDSDAQG